MDALLKTILEAPLPNLLIFAGLIFVGLSVLGGISGKLEPGKLGRIAAGVIGGLLLLLGIFLSLSGAGIPQAVRTAATSPLEAPLPNLLIVAGLLFVGVGVLGGISGKFEPDRQGRIAAGSVGGLLLLIGFVMVFSGASASQSVRALTPSPDASALPSAVAVLQATALPAAARAVTAVPNPIAPLGSVATAAPSAVALPTSVAAVPSNILVTRRDMSVTVTANGDQAFDEKWTVQFGSRATRMFGLTYNTAGGGAERKFDTWGISEGDVSYVENSSRQADHTFEVVPSTTADGTKHFSITWYFPTTVNQTRTFEIRYIWHGALTVTGDGVVVMRWRAQGPRSWTVGSSRIDIKLPRMYDPAQLFVQALWNGVDGPGARIVDGQNVAFTGQNITPDQSWDIQVRYPLP